MLNKLYFGDNLEVMRQYLTAASVDLVYLDPPFNSDARYNVLFTSSDGTAAKSQATAFRDSWSWEEDAARSFEAIGTTIGGGCAEIVNALHSAIGPSDTMAYLVMMAVRLHRIEQILRPGGALYLHCDPTASHYLKLILDFIFGPGAFRNEISWRRSAAHSDAKQGSTRFGNVRDIILFYVKRGAAPTWNTQYTAYSAEYVEAAYKHVDADGRRFRMGDLTAAKDGGDTRYEWRVRRREGRAWEFDATDEHLDPQPGTEYAAKLPYGARIWAYSRANMLAFEEQGRIVYNGNGMPNYKRYLDEMPGVALQNDWSDLKPVGASAAEREGYPTQKPLSLLERIIKVSSNPGDVVFDPFCGCGTTVQAAQDLGRNWIGIDISYHATAVIKQRLKVKSDAIQGRDYELLGMPRDFESAAAFAKAEPYQFQWWACYLLGVQQVEEKKGRDRGIDGKLFFMQGPGKGIGRMIVSVKAGKTGPAHVRDLAHVVQREKADGGIFVCVNPPTKDMAVEAYGEGFFRAAGTEFPRLQIVSMKEWFDAGLRPSLPSLMAIEEGRPAGKTKTPKRRLVDPRQPEFFFDMPTSKSSTVNPDSLYTVEEVVDLRRKLAAAAR